MKVISFYTVGDDNDYYEKCAERLRKNCSDLKIDLDLVEKKSLGSYRVNCLSKPQFILDKLQEHNQPVTWIDVDTIFRQYPVDFYNENLKNVDIAFSSSIPSLAGMKASPLYFANNEISKSFLGEWIHIASEVLKQMDVNFDHEILFGMFERHKEDCMYGVFPPTYCVWPGHSNEHTVIEMGLSDVPDKVEVLKKMGIDGDLLNAQTTGIL